MPNSTPVKDGKIEIAITRCTMSTYNNQTGRLSPQSSLQQRYIIAGQAGRGGMGAVYVATDTRVAHRRVAIKEMSQANLSEEDLPEATARFQQEAMMLGSLSHPNLPRIYDAFSENGRSYLVMDYIEGKTLFQILKEAHGQPLPVGQVLLYARQLCDVLSYLHQHNPPIIFRDIKPTNIMITENGHVYLIDFGIARFFKEGQQQDTILLGSPGYAPPEQHGTAQTSPRSDIYGLGATLHYCLTGRDPYYATDRFSFPSVRSYNPQIPQELDQLLQRMLAQDERARPASALEVQQILLGISQQAAEHTSSLDSGRVATQYNIPPAPSTTPAHNIAQAQAPTIAVSNATPPSTAPQTRPAYPARTSSMPQAIWTGGFIAISGIALVLTVGISLFALNFVCPSAHITEAGFSLVLAFIAIAASAFTGGLVQRGILFLTGIVVLVASLAFISQTLPDVTVIHLTNPTAICTPPAAQTLLGAQLSNLLLSAGLLVAGIISLYWLTRRGQGAERITLLAIFGASIICSALQFFLFTDANPLKHILLLVALITLIEGTLLSIQIERKGTPQTGFQQA
jgi:serine/threonine protein kinase